MWESSEKNSLHMYIRKSAKLIEEQLSNYAINLHVFAVQVALELRI